MLRTGHALVLVALVVSVGSACRHGMRRPESLAVARIEPDGPRLFLNQRIVLVFDRPIDPDSVTPDTVRFLDAAGASLPGRLEVRGDTVTFVPNPPLTRTLDDGSYKPGRRVHLVLPGFPRADTVRGRDGSFPSAGLERTWIAYGPDDLPPDVVSPLLPATAPAAFVLLPPPELVRRGGQLALRLRFSRPLYPPSIRPESFRLLPSGRGGLAVPFAQAGIEPLEGPGGYGSVLRLVPAWEPEPGFYRLFIEPGSRGPLDDRLATLLLPEKGVRGGMVLRDTSEGGGFVDLFVPAERTRPPWRESFEGARPGLERDPTALGLPADVEGALVWGGGVLRLPQPHPAAVSPLPPPDPNRSQVLRPGGVYTDRNGRRRRLPALDGSWVFRRFEVERGSRWYLVVPAGDARLRVRVLGAFLLRGELIVRFAGRPAAGPTRPGRPVLGDPRPTWDRVLPRVEITVLGLCRMTGRIAADKGGGAVPGFLWTRGPVRLAPTARSDLAVWIMPVAAATEPAPAPEPQVFLPGRWAAVGPWRPWVGTTGPRALLTDPADPPPGCRILVQGRKAFLGGRPTAWVEARRIADLGRVSALRIAVLQDGAHVPAGSPLLQRITIR